MQKQNYELPDWYTQSAAPIDRLTHKKAEKHQENLTKPIGALGELEHIATKFAGFQRKLNPQLKRVVIRVFAADHGVCAQNISAFPQAVTVQMIQNFVNGGAAISVLAKHLNAEFSVINMGTANPLISEEGVCHRAIAPGTRDFSEEAAMTDTQCLEALKAGAESVSDCDLFIGGEMGIGNTTSASAIYSALLDISATHSVGPGTGLDTAGQERKAAIITRALTLHAETIKSPLGVLQSLGGFEITALVGSYIASAQRGIPVLVDGFISTAAALLAQRLNPSVTEWLLYSHRSAEPAHQLALEALNAKPFLNLGMRLGEGSGAAVCVELLQTALRLHNEMATFEQAGVSEA